MKLYLRILSYIKPYLPRLTAAAICTVLAAVGNLYVPWIIKDVIDEVLAERNAGMLNIIAGGIIYTAGTLFFLMESLPFHTTIWHVFVLTATVAFFAAVTLHLADTSMAGLAGVVDLDARPALAGPES